MSYEEVFARVCRVCLRHCGAAVRMAPLHDGRLTDLAHAVLTFARITISVDDQLPRQICPKCLDLLKKAIAFKLTCERSHCCLQRLTRSRPELADKETQADVVQYSMFANYFPECVTNTPEVITDIEKDTFDVGKVLKIDFTKNENDLSDVDVYDETECIPFNVALKSDDSALAFSDMSPEEVWFTKKVAKCLKAEKKPTRSSRLLVGSDKKAFKKMDSFETLARQKIDKDRRTESLKEVLLGMRFGTEPRRPRVVCGVCGNVYSSKRLLRAHLTQHEGGASEGGLSKRSVASGQKEDSLKEVLLGMRLAGAERRGESYSGEGQRRASTARHTEYGYVCELSRKKAEERKRSEALEEELLGTRFEEPRPREDGGLVCGVCGKSYSTRGSLRAHTGRHAGFKFICEHCGKGFATKSEMEVHAMALHGLERHYACSHCDFKAKRRSELTDHVLTHTGERPYACDTCGLTFRRKAILRKHTVHHRGKEFKCAQCPKMFYHRNHLAAHTNNVHERRYLYRCTVPTCQATYAKSASVRKHLRDLHGVPREQQSRVLRVPIQTAPTHLG